MFCEKCGAQIPDDAQVCDKCGSAVESAQNTDVNNGMQQQFEQQPMQQQWQQPYQQQWQQPMQPAQPIKLTKQQKIIALVAAIAVVLAVVAMVIAKNHKYKINLNDFMVATYEGYDSVGTAQISFDDEAFDKKFGKKLKTSKGKPAEDAGIIIGTSLYGCYESYQSGLTNGQEITIPWNNVPAEALEKEFKCKIEYSDLKFTVSGLTPVNVVDPFEKLEVTFTGVDPDGYVEIEDNSNSDVLSNVYFSADKNSGLANGDEIVITAETYGDDEYFASNYGAVVSPKEKTYTVSGLGSYVTELSQISEDALEEMKQQADDVITTKAASWSTRSYNDTTVTGREYVGAYLLKAKDMSGYSDKNKLYLIYKLTSNVHMSTYGFERTDEVVYYYTVAYTDIIANEEGECTVDLQRYSTDYNSFNYEVDYNTGSSVTYTYTASIEGYKTIDEFVNANISSALDRYTFETDIEAQQ